MERVLILERTFQLVLLVELKGGKKMEEEKGFLSKSEFDKLDNPNYDLDEEKEKYQELLKDAYRNILEILKEYGYGED